MANSILTCFFGFMNPPILIQNMTIIFGGTNNVGKDLEAEVAKIKVQPILSAAISGGCLFSKIYNATYLTDLR